MAEMLKSLRFIPLCVLILSGYAFAEDYGNHSSDSDVAKRVAVLAAAAKAKTAVPDADSALVSYLRLIQNGIKKQLGDSLEIYKGKQCVLKMHLARDGFVSGISAEGGSSDLCNASIDAIHRIKKFPAPPSDAVYQKIKDSHLEFKP
ncbi:cell envelope integrity protein TolA [Salmonella enterica subsp. enterica serovar Virchow]|nr:cell envelope integrity protein TolA [Salmonella enterica subsp. enterica serovar Virchow]